MKRLLLVAILVACGDDGVSGGDPNELITTVTLSFTPSGGGTAIVASVDDPDGDGGNPPVADPVNLTAGTYTLAVAFLNKLETPPEDITREVADESDAHQLFFLGSAVSGPATTNTGAPLAHAYADTDANGFPIGLQSTITATAGTGTLQVVLQHVPRVNDTAVKTGSLADTVKTGGIAGLPGDTDANVSFTATVQ